MSEQMREAFDEYLDDRCVSNARGSDGEYLYNDARNWWPVWQAALATRRPSKEWYAKGIAETLDMNELIGPMGMICPHSNRSDCALFENKK